MMAIGLPNWKRAVLFVWWCFVAPQQSINYTGLLVAQELQSNSASNLEPASDLRCFSFDFKYATCEWTRGGDANSTDVLIYNQGRESDEYAECRISRFNWECNSTNCRQKCATCYDCYYLVRTTNDFGQKVNSTDRVRFNINEMGTLKPPSNVRVTNKSFSELMVRWSPPDPKPNNIVYILEYRWEGSSGSWLKEENIEAEYDILVDLEHPYGLYSVRMKTKRSNYFPRKESVYTEEAQGRTTEKAPIDVPKDFHCQDAPNQNNNTRHVHLFWKPLQNEYKLNGEILGYVITYSSSEASKQISLDTGANDSNYTVYDLKKDQHYSFRIQTRNSMGTSTKKELCSQINPVPVGPLPVGIVVGVCFSIVIFIIIVICIWCCLKKRIRKFPAIRLPSLLQEDNEYLSEHRNHRVVREVEVFDDIKPCPLFVDLGPKQTDVIDIFSDMPIITDGFDIGDKPRGAVGFQNDVIDLDSLPLLGLKGDLMLDDIPSVTEPLLPGSRREEDPSSGDEYGGALPSSPVSIGSGGSYLGIRDDDDMVYSCMTKDGLSPVEKEDIEGQRVRGDRPQVLAPRPQDSAPSPQDSALSPQDSALSPHVDGLPLLHWRRENADSNEDNLQDGDAVDSYTKMSTSPLRENNHAAAGPVKKDPQADRHSTQKAKHMKPSSVGAKGKGGGNVAGATYAGDGSISDYVQQGFVPGAASQGDGDYDPGELTDSYSRLGLLGETGAASSSQGNSLDNLNQDSAVSPKNRAESNIGQEGRTGDSSNPLPDKASSTVTGAVAPCSQPGSEPRPSNEPPAIPNMVRVQSLDSLSDDEDDGGLNYVTVALDSDIDSVNGIEPVDINGYVTQAMMPNNLDAPAARRVPNDTVNNAAPSGYVDQAQLSTFSPPPFARSPANSNPVQMNGTVANGSGYVTAAEARDIMSPGPDGGPVDENTMNNNNNNPRTENAAPIPSTYESGLDNNERGYATQRQATGMLVACPGPNGAATTRNTNGLAPTQPASPGYVTADQLARLPLPSPETIGHVNGHPVDPDTGDYVAHDEMLHMADGTRNRNAKSSNGHVGNKSGEQ